MGWASGTCIMEGVIAGALDGTPRTSVSRWIKPLTRLCGSCILTGWPAKNDKRIVGSGRGKASPGTSNRLAAL